MDEPETKTCPNCKREIPAVNFTIHTVHCARNIKVCPVCKEPVPLSDLAEHHETMHKLLPCKKCGEQVCGTDLEDHIRDSCAHTIQTCKYCELELPRGELPAHEGYCGVRTEQCPECREWVMIKYRQLHLDSNHGFLRLDDDPPPPKKEVPKVTRPQKPSNIAIASTSRMPSSGTINSVNDGPSTSNGPRTTINRFTDTENRENETKHVDEQDESTLLWRQYFMESARQAMLPKRTNDQPQINTNTADKPKNTTKKLINKKRQAPPPPSPEPRRDLPYYSAMQRRQDEEQQRREQTAYNLARGLPPVLSPAAKLERLRKMDQMANWGMEPGPSRHNAQNNDDAEESWNPEELRNLQPMTMQQFERRFNALRLASDTGGPSGVSGSNSSNSGATWSYSGNRNLVANRCNGGVIKPSAGGSMGNAVASKNNAGANKNNGGVNKNNAGANENNIGANRNNAAANRNNAEADRNNAGGNRNNAGASMCNTGANRNNAGASMCNAGANRNNAGASMCNAGANRNNAGASMCNAGANRNNAGASMYNAGANRNNAGVGMSNAWANRNNAGASVSNARANLRYGEVYRNIGAINRLNEEANMCDSGANRNNGGANRQNDGANIVNDNGVNDNDRAAHRNNRANGREDRPALGDRFNEIKSSLRELRRGLNEVTAPYNFNQINNEGDRHRPRGLDRPDVGERDGLMVGGRGDDNASGGEDVQLPCEFCGQLQPLQNLVLHQTGCRPDLAQLRSSSDEAAGGRASSPPGDDLPVIPCEFCTESLPLYLISEHQERCQRDTSPLYLD